MNKLNKILNSLILKLNEITSDYVKRADVPVVPSKISAFENDKEYINTETDPTVPSWAKSEKKPVYTAEEVNADQKGTASNAVVSHNTSADCHNDIRLLIQGLTERINFIANSEDIDLDQLSEVVTYIKSNRTLIENITTNKVNISDIANNLTTNVSNVPLSAAAGVMLKALIDAIVVPTKLSQLGDDIGYLTSQSLLGYAKSSDIPTNLSQLFDDATHRVVTDTEKAAWNAKSNFSGKYEDLSGKPTIPSLEGYMKESDVEAMIERIVLQGYLNNYRIRVGDYAPEAGYITIKKG